MDRRHLHYRQTPKSSLMLSMAQLSAAFLRASEPKWSPWCSPAPAWSKTCCWPRVKSLKELIPTAEGEIRWAGQRSLSYLPRRKGAQRSSKQTQALRNTPQWSLETLHSITDCTHAISSCKTALNNTTAKLWLNICINFFSPPRTAVRTSALFITHFTGKHIQRNSLPSAQGSLPMEHTIMNKKDLCCMSVSPKCFHFSVQRHHVIQLLQACTGLLKGPAFPLKPQKRRKL